MKTSFYSFGILFISLNCYSQCEAIQVSVNSYGICENDPWVLVLEEQFQQNELNTTLWNSVLGVPRDFSFESSKQWHTPDNVQISNGILSLDARKETVTNTFVTNWATNPPETQTSTFEFTSAEIWSKYSFGYGKYEILCKIPKGKGMFPAFWTFGGPGWDELDVFEFRNKYTNNNFDINKSVRTHEMNTHHDYDNDGDSENCGEIYEGDRKSVV